MINNKYTYSNVVICIYRTHGRSFGYYRDTIISCYTGLSTRNISMESSNTNTIILG